MFHCDNWERDEKAKMSFLVLFPLLLLNQGKVVLLLFALAVRIVLPTAIVIQRKACTSKKTIFYCDLFHFILRNKKICEGKRKTLLHSGMENNNKKIVVGKCIKISSVRISMECLSAIRTMTIRFKVNIKKSNFHI